jgi:hypothetical protein
MLAAVGDHPLHEGICGRRGGGEIQEACGQPLSGVNQSTGQHTVLKWVDRVLVARVWPGGNHGVVGEVEAEGQAALVAVHGLPAFESASGRV